MINFIDKNSDLDTLNYLAKSLGEDILEKAELDKTKLHLELRKDGKKHWVKNGEDDKKDDTHSTPKQEEEKNEKSTTSWSEHAGALVKKVNDLMNKYWKTPSKDSADLVRGKIAELKRIKGYLEDTRDNPNANNIYSTPERFLKTAEKMSKQARAMSENSDTKDEKIGEAEAWEEASNLIKEHLNEKPKEEKKEEKKEEPKPTENKQEEKKEISSNISGDTSKLSDSEISSFSNKAYDHMKFTVGSDDENNLHVDIKVAGTNIQFCIRKQGDSYATGFMYKGDFNETSNGKTLDEAIEKIKGQANRQIQENILDSLGNKKFKNKILYNAYTTMDNLMSADKADIQSDYDEKNLISDFKNAHRGLIKLAKFNKMSDDTIKNINKQIVKKLAANVNHITPKVLANLGFTPANGNDNAVADFIKNPAKSNLEFNVSKEITD